MDQDLHARLAFLEDQNRFLLEEKRQTLDALELAVSLVHLTGTGGEEGDRISILQEVAARAGLLIPCTVVGFWMVDPASLDFQRVLVQPYLQAARLEARVDHCIQDGGFSWALAHSKPLLLEGQGDAGRLLLHPLRTPTSTQGMFVAELAVACEEIQASILAILSILLHAGAQMLESDMMARRLALANQELMANLQQLEASRAALAMRKEDLERVVAVRTQDLWETNARLQEEVARRASVEQELRLASRRLTEAFDATSDGLWEHYLLTGREYHSPRWAAMLGYEQHEVDQTQEGWTRLLHHDDLPHGLQRMEQYRQGIITEHTQEQRLRAKDGSWRWILSRGKVVEWQEGAPARVVGTHQDITARKRLEEELTQARDAAHAASRAKSEFLATMTHEIRTPLNAIIGMAELMAMGDCTTEQAEYVETVSRQARSLLTILNDILDLARMETMAVEPGCAPFALRRMVESAMEPFQAEAKTKSLQLQTIVDDALPDFLMGDGPRLRHVLFHLVGNGVKFTNEGTVEVMVTQLPAKNDESSESACPAPDGGASASQGPPARVLFAVRDTGQGIPRDKQTSMFQAFTQADGSFARPKGGLGLGLALARSLVKLMGGQLWMSSVEGRGSVFSFSVPLASLAAQETAAKEAAAQKAASQDNAAQDVAEGE